MWAMQKIESSSVPGPVAGVHALLEIDPGRREIPDSCTWQQIIKILEENGFSKRNQQQELEYQP